MANQTKNKNSGSWKKERASVNRKSGTKPKSNKYRPSSDGGKRPEAGHRRALLACRLHPQGRHQSQGPLRKQSPLKHPSAPQHSLWDTDITDSATDGKSPLAPFPPAPVFLSPRNPRHSPP